jgi:hypothetical protein
MKKKVYIQIYLYIHKFVYIYVQKIQMCVHRVSKSKSEREHWAKSRRERERTNRSARTGKRERGITKIFKDMYIHKVRRAGRERPC